MRKKCKSGEITINQSTMSFESIQQQSSVVEVNTPLFNGLAAMQRAYGEEVVRALSAKYGFPYEEGVAHAIRPQQMRFRKAELKPRKKKEKLDEPKKFSAPEIPLPWTGVIREGCCEGIRLNHGLHTQCVMRPLKSGVYCKTCQKQADASSNGIPTYGNVTVRSSVGILAYRDPKGKQSTPYATVMKKLNISRSDAEEAASKIGLTIPEECFAERKVQKGRPKANGETSSDSENDASAKKPAKAAKKAGRPKKQLKVQSVESADDLIANLVAQANTTAPMKIDGLKLNINAATPTSEIASSIKKVALSPKAASPMVESPKAPTPKAPSPMDESPKAPTPKAASPMVESPKTPTPQTGPTVQAIEGVKYYNQDGWLYDMQTREAVGFWNGVTIEPVEDDSDDEE